MRRNPTPTTFMLFIISFFFLLFSSCQKDSDLFAEAILDDPDPVVDGSDDGDDAEVEVATITLNAIDDAYIQDGEGINEGIVRVETNIRTTYLKFDLSSIEGTITGAYLEFTTDSDQGNGHLEVYKGTGNDWTEENLSLENAPSQGELLGEVDSEYAVGFDQQIPLDSDLLTSSLLSIVLNIKSGNDIAIASKESPNNQGPRLVVEYMGKVNQNGQEDNADEDDELDNVVIDNVITLNDLKAFPSAFGAGKDFRINPSTARIYEVTNLNDSGPGSFREAFEATGPRIIIVKVEGIADMSSHLDNQSSSNGNVAIWGQMAPGLGMTLIVKRFSWRNSGNILIRHITSQHDDPGCTPNENCFDCLNFYKQEANTSIYVDHCSFRYASDQVYTIESEEGTAKSTSAYLLIAEANPAHNTGTIIGDQGKDENDVGNFTFARNMFYNISHRTPNMSGRTGGFEVYNNWVSNWNGRLSRTNGNIDVDWFKNYAQGGNMSHWTTAHVNQMGDGITAFYTYTADNYVTGFDESPSGNQTNLWVNFKDNSEGGDEESILSYHYESSRINNFGDPADGIWDAMDVPNKLQHAVGHNRGVNADGSPGFFRDDIDTEYIERSLNGNTPSRYREPSEWTNSSFTNTDMYVDSDGDHMPDWFENQHAHLNPNDPSDMLKTHVDWTFSDGYGVVNNAGYTNLEICAEYYAGGFETMIDGTNNLKN
ncbi:MAG: DNRLRE domain-containing protein [Allomuricauda sp.]